VETTDRFGSLLKGDWRSIGGEGEGSGQAEPFARGRSGALSYHVAARRASGLKERQRARDIVAKAKEGVATTFEDARFGHKLNVDQLWPIISGINASVSRHSGALTNVTRLREKHEATYIHSIAVCGLMIALARQLGIDPGLHHDIGLGGLLHDIGKAKVPAMLLDKPGALSADETAVIRGHSQLGFEMLIGGEQKLPEIALDICLHHHERIDGAGYPDRRSGENISLYARMAAICDSYDMMTSATVYRPACTPAEALERLVDAPGQFDSQIVSAFSVMIGVFPVGSMVRLQSNRLAVVLDCLDGDPAMPPVCPFFCIDTRQLLPRRLSPPGVDPIIGVELPSRWPAVPWLEVRQAIMNEFEIPAEAR